MPVPSGGLEADMLLGCEMTLQRTQVADEQEDRADDNVKAVEARRHKEVGVELVSAKLPTFMQQVLVFVYLI